MLQVSKCYQNGVGVEESAKLARDWLRRAADLGSPVAMTTIGTLYMCGDGVKQCSATALSWYRRAAETNFGDALFFLGDMYASGLGVERNVDIAFEYFTRAHNAGSYRGSFGVGRSLVYGHGVAKDTAMGLSVLRGAADRGSADAMCEIGIIYNDGVGVARDAAMARRWFERALEREDCLILAMLMLGDLYQAGDGVEQNYLTSHKWFRRAAELGNAEAMVQVGQGLLTGEGVEMDKAAGMEWLNRAIEKDSSTATFFVARLYVFGVGVKRDVAKGSQMMRRAAKLGDERAIEVVKVGFVTTDGDNQNTVSGLVAKPAQCVIKLGGLGALLGISPGDNIQALLHALMDHSTAAICNAHGRHEVPEVVQFIFRDEVRTRLGSTTNARDYTLDDLASLITDIECRIIERVNVSKQQIRSKSSPPAKKPRAMVAAMGVRAPNQENAPEQRPIKKHAHLVCFNCLQRGHIAVNCPSAPANKAATRSFCIVCGLSDHMCESCPQRKRSPVDKHTYLDL